MVLPEKFGLIWVSVRKRACEPGGGGGENSDWSQALICSKLRKFSLHGDAPRALLGW